jgi:hypothetical protein
VTGGGVKRLCRILRGFWSIASFFGVGTILRLSTTLKYS